MKLAILGGSFNPVHKGHLYLAESVLKTGYDRIVLIPAFQSPFKIGAGGATPADRLDMLCISITADHRLTVDECEIQREGVSYTIDTIADIKKRYLPEGKPGLILGDDLTDSFHLWRNAKAISEETDIIVARRTNDAGKKVFPFPHRSLNNPVLDNSSRQVREKIKKGESWEHLVPPGAGFLIKERGLYGCKLPQITTRQEVLKKMESAELELINHGDPMDFFENLVLLKLDTQRFIHSRNTALFAMDLCLRHGLDPQKGYLAGITHDLCKTMSGAELLELAQSDGAPVTMLDREKPGLLHGRAAAVLLKTKYYIYDSEVLEAVRWHVTGNLETGPLAKIIYIADKIEVSRTWVENKLREMSQYAELDELFKTVLKYTLRNLESNNIEMTDEGKSMLRSLNSENC